MVPVQLEVVLQEVLVLHRHTRLPLVEALACGATVVVQRVQEEEALLELHLPWVLQLLPVAVVVQHRWLRLSRSQLLPSTTLLPLNSSCVWLSC